MLWTRVPTEPMTDLDQKVRERAQALGFDRVGVASAEGPLEPEFSRYEGFVEAAKHGKRGYLAEGREARRRVDAAHILEGAKSIICVAEAYGAKKGEDPDAGIAPHIALYARGSDYHNHLRRRLRRLAAFLRRLAPGTSARP